MKDHIIFNKSIRKRDKQKTKMLVPSICGSQKSINYKKEKNEK